VNTECGYFLCCFQTSRLGEDSAIYETIKRDPEVLDEFHVWMACHEFND
jgi:hypothetical protein